jgi:hypothetical protein
MLLLGGGVVITLVALLTVPAACIYAVRQFVVDQRQQLALLANSPLTSAQQDRLVTVRSASLRTRRAKNVCAATQPAWCR